MLRLALQSASLWRGTLAGCAQLLTLPMGSTSSLDHMTRQFESGILRLALQSASLWRGTLAWCAQLLTLPMGGTSPQGHLTTQFESGMLKLTLQSVSLWKGTLALWRPSHTLPIRSISLLDLVTWPFTYGTHFHKFPSGSPRTSRLNGQTKRVGSEIRVAAYSIGYPITIVQVYIHLLSSQSLAHPRFGQFLFTLTSLHLEGLGPKFPTLHGPSLSLFLTCCLLYWLLVLVLGWSFFFVFSHCPVLPGSRISSIYNDMHI